MNEKTNLYVFERKEVALIFGFVILIALISFLFGVKIGTVYSYSQAGFKVEDRANVELLSTQEERVKDIVNINSKDQGDSKAIDEKLQGDLEAALEAEYEKEFSDTKKVNAQKIETRSETDQDLKKDTELDETAAEVSAATKEMGQQEVVNAPPRDELSGKFTIQLKSYKNMQAAKDYANGFKIRGYKPIINEVDLKGKGIWYRVSLGVFDSITEAKDFVLKESSLFQDSTGHIFTRFD